MLGGCAPENLELLLRRTLRRNKQTMRSVINVVMTAVTTRVTKNAMPTAVSVEGPADRGKGKWSFKLCMNKFQALDAI